MKKLFVILVIALGITTFAKAQDTGISVTKTADAKAKLVRALSVALTSELNFGTLAVTTSGGTATITSGAVVSGDANVTPVTGDLATTAAVPTFTIAGENSAVCHVSIPATIGVATGDGSGATKNMTITTANDLALAGHITLSGAGAAAFKVFGSLAVGANQVLGQYTGTFDVTVSYQ